MATRRRAGLSGVRIPTRVRFFFSPKIKTGSGANPASLNVYRGPFWVSSDRKRGVDHLSLSGAEVTNDWSCTATAPVCLCLIGMDRNSFTFLPYHLQGGVTPTYPFLLFYFFLCLLPFFYLLYSGCTWFGSPPDNRLP